MKIQLIRNATMRIDYAGLTILTDPCLADAGSLPAYAGRAQNPTAALPMPVAQVLSQVDLVLVSHLHKDHFDADAMDRIPKDTPILCRAEDAGRLKDNQFGQLHAMDRATEYHGIRIEAVPARHGTSDGVLQDMGTTCGFMLQSRTEPTVYWVGDSVWYEKIEETIARWQPEVILTHSGGAVWNKDEFIVMDAEQTIRVCRAAPASLVVAIHLEAFDHCTVSRKKLREHANQAGISDNRLLIPADGEKIVFGNSDQHAP